MTEAMLSREEAAELQHHIHEFVEDLEASGFERAMIASAMAGVGIGIRAASDGAEATFVMLDMLKAAIFNTTSRIN